VSTQEAAPAAGARVLVTGAGGRLGGRLAALLASRFRVTAGVRRSPAPAGLPALALDVTDPASVARALDATRWAAVLHCAAKSLVGESLTDPGLYYRNNVGGGVSLLEAMRLTGVNRLVFSSTAAVYGEPRRVPIA